MTGIWGMASWHHGTAILSTKLPFALWEVLHQEAVTADGRLLGTDFTRCQQQIVDSWHLEIAGDLVGDLGLPQEISGGRFHETVFEFSLMKSASSFYRLETQFSMAKCSMDNQADRRTLLQLAKDWIGLKQRISCIFPSYTFALHELPDCKCGVSMFQGILGEGQPDCFASGRSLSELQTLMRSACFICYKTPLSCWLVLKARFLICFYPVYLQYEGRINRLRIWP